MKKATKMIVSSLIAVALCVSLISGATFALFTSTSEVNIAVTSGKVAVTASGKITKVYSADPDDNSKDNVIEESSEGFASSTFALGGTVAYEGSTLTISEFMPGDGIEFRIDATNESTVSIKYQTVVTFVSGGNVGEEEGNDSALFRALKISVGEDNNMQDISSNRSTAVSAWSAPIEAGAAIPSVTVSIKFPIDSGNGLQSKSCKIAIGLYAVQANGNDTTKKDTYFVTGDSNLSDVFGEAASGDTIVLAESMTAGEELSVEGGKDLSVDLSGNSFGVSKEDSTSNDLVVAEGSKLTVKDSTGEGTFAVETKANSNNAPAEREAKKDGDTDGKNYTLKVEGELNFEGADVEVTNKYGDIGICVDGGSVNFDDTTELTINGKSADDGYLATDESGEGFGDGFYVTGGGEVNFNGASVISNGAVTSFIAGGGSKDNGGTININGGEFEFKDMFNSVNYATFVSAIRTYENGTININGAKLSLTGAALNKQALEGGPEASDHEYSNMILFCCIGGGKINVNACTITLAPTLGLAFVAQTVCSYYTPTTEEIGECAHKDEAHRGVQCDAHITIGGATKIYLNSAGHQTASDSCYVFAASRNGKQIAQYGSSFSDEYTGTNAETYAAVHAPEMSENPDEYCTIHVGNNVEIYFSEVGIDANINDPKYDEHKLSSLTDLTAQDDKGIVHSPYYVYDLSRTTSYMEHFINRYNSKGVQFLDSDPFHVEP